MELDAAFIVLERIRNTISLLKKSNVSNELVVNGKSLLSILKELQSFVRYGDIGQMEYKSLLLPYLHILSSRNISGPFVRCATDAIQAFLLGDVFDRRGATALSEALHHIATAIASCKFIHTDVAGDELVQLQLIETLRILLVCPVAANLSDSTQWHIVEFCCLTMAKTGGQSGTMLLYQAAERVVHTAVSFSLGLSGNVPGVAEDGYVYSTGVPCVCRVVGYCVRILSDAAGVNTRQEGGSSAPQRSSTPPVHHRGTSQGTATPLPLNEASYDRTTLHVLFVLRLVRGMFTRAAQAPHASQLLIRSKEFARLVGDELGFTLLLLSGGSAGSPGSAGAGPGSAAGGASTPGRSGSSSQLNQQLLTAAGGPVVLSAVLSLFEALLHAAGPALRILVEGFARQVYLRALLQTYSLFIDQIKFLAEGVDLVSPMVAISGRQTGLAPQPLSLAEGGFRLDELEVILESFADLLSAPALLSCWFASFDCDPVSANLVQPIVEYASRCSCLAWTFSSEFSGGYFKDIAALVVQLFRHICKTLHTRSSGKGSPAGLLSGQDLDRMASIAGLLKASRGAKDVLATASALFVEKPEKGLRYLQERGSLPTPLTPDAVAAFLRLAPDLPKESAGAYLGELGKEDAGCYDGNSKEFHRLVLLRYVESFEFSNQTVLECMRIFLSAFRLPGKAQQIDRILVAFSEHCHSQCLEGRQGLLENAEVTYVLTFSIIMLNTDRHNPNVKADRKMTLEQFVRNNTMYGKDSNQTIPLSRELLTAIFTSIDEFPIRTEGKALAAVATSEVWKDSQMQARADPRRAVMLSTQRHGSLLRDMLAASSTSAADRDALDSLLREVSPAEVAHGIVTPASIVRRLLASKPRTSSVADPLLLSLEVAGRHALFDEDMLGCVWLDLLRGCLCVHIHNAVVMEKVFSAELDRGHSSGDPGLERGPTIMKQSQLRKLVGSSNTLLSELLHITNSHKLGCALDCTNLVLSMCAGMIKGPMAEKLLEFMCWDKPPGRVSEDISPMVIVDAEMMLYQFRHFESARLAASTLLTVIQQNQAAISQWSLVWCFLGGLRDCGMLPREMVVDSDADLLPPNIREEFELVLLDLDRRTFDQHRPLAPKRVRRQSASLLSLQGLGEALFGGSSVDSEEGGEDSPLPDASSTDAGSHAADITEFKRLFKLDALSARWDAGYEDSDSPRRAKSGTKASDGHTGEPTPSLHASAQKLRSNPTSESTKSNTVPAFSIVDGGATLENLRALVAASGVAQLVSDSRFLPEASLDGVLRSLVCVAECKDEAQRALAELAEAALAEVAPLVPVRSVPSEKWAVDGFLTRCNAAVQGRHSFSSASVAWLEMVLVEVSLRNRDRFQFLWPALKHHYVRVLCGTAVGLSYVTERRVLGILKICTRMISRDNLAGTILELLGRIFARSPSTPSAGSVPTASQKGAGALSPLSAHGARGSTNTADDDEEGGYTLSKPHFPPMSGVLLHQLSNQIAASMWRVLTLNVDILPMLPLEQWQTLFTIIAISAAAGGFASIKSFEAMAWLLHEPRLVAKVPVFCIIGVRPLLKNHLAPLSVSIGAVHLLTHLHGRLEVLIREDKEDYVDCELDETSMDGDTPILWESCWTPILRALGEGIADTRAPVREACAEALCQAILDRHSHAVPAGVLVDILGSIIAPMIVQLRDHLVDEINHSLPAGMDKLLTSKEATALTQQQWVNVDGAVPEDVRAGADNIADRLAPLRAASAEARGGGTVSVLMECLSALCRSFLQHLRKLLAYPSFDKLWLCILTVLGHFLDSNVHGAAELAAIARFWDALKEGTKLLVQDLHAMLGSSRDHLQRMLRSLRQEHVFETRSGLLKVTRDMIRHFDDHAELLDELQGL